MSEAGVLRIDCLNSADPTQVARWEAFVMACPEATFFHRAGWQTVLRKVFGHATYFLFAHNNGDIQGVLPLGEIRSRLFGHSLTSLPFAVYGGVAAANDAAREALEAHAKQQHYVLCRFAGKMNTVLHLREPVHG